MKEAEIYVLATAEDDLPDKTHPLYQSAVTSLVIRKTLENIETAGIKITSVENSDFSSYRTALSTYLDNAHDRESEIISDGVSAIAANLPDVLSIGAAFASGGSSAVVACVLNIMLGKLLGGDSGALAGFVGTGADMSEVVTELQTLNARLQNSTGESIAQIAEDATMGLNAMSQRYPLIWNLINQALRIIVAKDDTYDDIIVEEG